MSGRLNSQIGRPWVFLTNVTDTLKNIAVPAKGTFPMQQQLLTTAGGAITATQSAANAKHLVLSSANWASEKLQVGDCIYIQDVLRQVVTIWESKTLIELDYAFPATVTAVNVFVTQPIANRHVKVEAVGAANTATVNGVALPNGESVEFHEPAGIAPIYYDADGATEQLKFTVSQ